MIWIFKREHESLRLETRYDKETKEYVLIIHSPDDGQLIERFNDGTTFESRLDTLDKQLSSENWRYVGAPVLLRDGWKI